MKEQLSTDKERLIEDFQCQLMLVDTVEEMFPPDAAGDFEKRYPYHPAAPTCEQVCLAAVYDLNACRRRNQERMMMVGSAIVSRIDSLV